MAYSPPNEDTVHFQGVGNMSTANLLYGGGCTKAAWAASGSVSDFCGAHGAAITTSVNATYDHTGNGNGERNIALAGIGTGVTVGTLAYISGTNITTGVYEITEVAGDGSWVNVADIDATGDNADTTCNIGGAIGDPLDNAASVAWLQSILDAPSTDAADYNRYILIYNWVDPAEDNFVTIDLDTNSGDRTDDTWVRVIGCDSSFVPLTHGNYVTIDAVNTDVGAAIFLLTDRDNIGFENIKCYRNNSKSAGSGAGEDGWLFATTGDRENFIFKNCATELVSDGINTGSTINNVANLILVDCDISGAAYSVYHYGIIYHSYFYNNIFTTTGAGENVYIRAYSANFSNCVFNGGNYTLYTPGASLFCQNCVFYSFSEYGIFQSGTIAEVLAINCIFDGDAVGDYAIRTDGSFLILNDNQMYSTAGGAALTHEYNYDGATDKDLEANWHANGIWGDSDSVATAPDWVNAGSDWRVNSGDYDSGKPTLGQDIDTNMGFTTRGAWQATQTQAGGGGGGAKYENIGLGVL